MDLLRIIILIDFVLAFIGLIIPKAKRLNNEAYCKVLNYLFGFLLFHFTYVFLCKTFYPGNMWIENSAPFGLMYGPFIYFASKAGLRMKIYKKEVLVLCAPYIVFELLHIAFLLFGVQGDSILGKVYMDILSSFIAAGFIGFSVYSIWLYFKNEPERITKFFINAIFSGILIIGVGFLFVKALILEPETNPNIVDSSGLLIYLVAFLMILSIYFMLFIWKQNDDDLTLASANAPPAQAPSTSPDQSTSYANSSLSEDDIDRYVEKLDKYVESEEPWKNTELRLKDLAETLKMPKHHLTQVLNTRKNKTFNEYINGMRVEYALEFLNRKDKSISMEDIGYRSGFNSKTSFYRWFKKLKNMTPAAYMKSLIEEE